MIKRRAVAPSHKIYSANLPVFTSEVTDASKIKELMVRTVTWTRESHGLFDFEGSEIMRKQFKIKGSHRFFRNVNEVETQAVEDLDTFQAQEDKMEESRVD